jgi:hypothetical protein
MASAEPLSFGLVMRVGLGTKFHLTTAGEYELLSFPRECHVLRRLVDVHQNPYFLVRITPALIGQSFGLGGDDIHELLVGSRHRGYSIASIEVSVEVYVARITNQAIRDAARFGNDDVELIAWGVVFARQQDAMAWASKMSSDLK